VLEQSRVIQAGAGTGKTHRLVTLCLQLLGEGLSPARLCAVTFTEKAAAELKGRIRKRVEGLAAGGAEPSVPQRGGSFWAAVARDLPLAQVGTIHSLCAQMLRRHAPAAGIDPRFTVLDEQEARRLRVDSCEKAVLSALARGDVGARRLCAEMGLRTQGKFGAGLVEELAGLLASLAESGEDPRQLVEACAGLRPDRALADDARAREQLALAIAALQGAQTGAPAAPLPLDYPPGELRRVWPQLAALLQAVPAARGRLTDQVNAAKDAFQAVLNADAGVRGAALARELARLAAEARLLQQGEKARNGALDFDDLTRHARELFTGDVEARAGEQSRIGALLVDEMQDTSRVQLALLSALAPGGVLTVVGDRKQSIYEFRGADVASAQAFAGRLLARGAEREVLQDSRRSRPSLVRFENLLFAKALAANAHPFDTPFSADDELTAIRTEPGPCAELIDITAGPGVEAEAEAVARRLSALLASGIRGGEVAILLRRMTNLETFRRALLRRRIPHLVHRGHGFLAAREVLDVRALLDAAADPDDELAVAAVLRSPFGPLSDDALVLLAREHGLGRRALQMGSASLAPDDAEVLESIARLLFSLENVIDRLGPASFLEAALADADYVAACAGGLYGEQAAANVDRLLGLARTAEAAGKSVRAFAGDLRTLADEEAREPEAPVVEEHDPHAVRILTIHAAKGLEFPVVFVPECATSSFIANAERVQLDPELGLACKVMGADGERRHGPHGAALRDRRKARELSQSRRLFYVAVTRARDLLVLSGRAAKAAECWRGFVDQISARAVADGLLTIVPDGGPAAAAQRADRAPFDPAAVTSLPDETHPDVDRIVSPVVRAQPSIAAPVTVLADAAACARRYQLLHELGLPEHPDAGKELQGALGPDGAPASALGTLAHRLLELMPLPARELRRDLSRILAQEGEDPREHEELLDAACAFVDSPLGARMTAAGPGRLQRELPFVLRLAREGAPELLVRGQIDALLLDGGCATVVDYKLSRLRPVERYAAQLDAYALAAREITGGEVPVQTGIVFLRSKGAPFVERRGPDEAALHGISERLLDAGERIARGRASGEWPKIDRARCEAIECGFVTRCHG
jgi:ATP-dependent exoDNAse (exonuclease V) beta subunit